MGGRSGDPALALKGSSVVITQFLDLYSMILRKLVKRDDYLEAGPQALQDGQATRSEVGNADREPSQFLDGWVVLQESCT